MKLSLIAVGSRGDVQPYLALGRRLVRAGLSVRVAALDPFADDVRAAGLTFAYLGAFPERFRARRGSERGGSSASFSGVPGRALFWAVFPTLIAPVEERFIAACEGADAVLFTRLALPVPHIAESLKIPCIAAFPVPHTPTNAFENPLYVPRDGRAAGALRTRWSYSCESHLTHQLSYPVIARLRRRLGLRALLPHQIVAHRERQLAGTIYAYSERVVPRPCDWPERVQVTGYWFLDAVEDWQPSRALEEFLAAGSKPVCVGFGSMKSTRPERVARMLRGALERIRERAVVLSGWGGMRELDPTGRRILVLPEAPHDWLYPRVGVAVHHGGAGTTAAALRAGVPSVIVPHAFDQRFWGRRVRELGCGPAAIEERDLSASRLGDAMRDALDDERHRGAAARLGAALRAEDGVGCAVSLIEQWTSCVASA